MASKLAPHHDDIHAAIHRGESKAMIARRLGVSRTTLRDYVNTHLAFAEFEPVVEEIDENGPSREELLEHELKDLRRRVRRARSLDVQSELVLEQVREALTAAPVRFTPAAKPDDSGASHVQALLLSDLHGGEVVSPEEVDGLNEFNWEILLARMERIFQALLSFQEHRPYPIHELQLWLLGDMCSGANHQEIAETNEFAVAEQSYRVGMLLAQFIERLVPHFPKLVVHGVAGNHPRATVKPASKQVFNNWDWMAYKLVETYLGNYESIECHFPKSGFAVAEIAGQSVLLFHGDGIRSTMPGVPWGGVVRRTNELKKQYAQRGVYLDGFALGHFHQANVVQGSVFLNGSVKGTDEYALKQFGSGEKPTQLLLTFDATNERLTDTSYITP